MQHTTQSTTLLLAGDLGGTKTNLAIFSADAGRMTPVVESTLSSTAYPSLEALTREFLKQVNLPVTHAAFGVAGPVVDGRATITNLNWTISETELASALGLRAVSLLNDLVSIANAIPVLADADRQTLNQGVAIHHGPIAVVAPGTGLGEAYLVHDGSGYHAYPSEGGHADFAPNSALEDGLVSYLRSKFGRVSWERVCSGLGIPNIYEYLKSIHFAEEPAWLAEELARSQDQTPIIVNTALDPERACALCTATLNTFVSILGSEAGNMTLKVLATGGVYLGGGIPPRILPLLQSETFLNAFRNKGRFADFMGRIPVHVILNPKAALLGAARYGAERISKTVRQ